MAPPGGSPDSVVNERGLDDVASVDVAVSRTPFDVGRRRFTIASLIAMGLTAIPFIWILWSEWGPPTLFRQAVYEDNFFDLQTRAMFHGHLSLPNGALGLEGFVHDGRTYTYFGLFGSIIRMPILLITSSLDGKLTTLSILVAWLVTGLFAALLALEGSLPPSWRRRHGQDRGDGLRGLDGHHHGRVGLDGVGGHSLRLRRGHRVEHLPHRRKHSCPSRSGRATVMGSCHRQRSPHPVREPRPRDDWLGLCSRRRPHCGVVLPRTRWA